MLTGGENMKLVSEGLKAYERLDLRVLIGRQGYNATPSAPNDQGLGAEYQVLDSVEVSTAYFCSVCEQAVHSA